MSSWKYSYSNGTQKDSRLFTKANTAHFAGRDRLVEQRILLIREQKVMLDADLAQVYGVTTKRLLQQVYRNRERFPADFMFQLNAKEMDG
jgi:hypothetical protein